MSRAWLAPALCVLLAACASASPPGPVASGGPERPFVDPAEVRKAPGDFRLGEGVADVGGRAARTGTLGGVAYAYATDFRSARVAGRPGAGPEALDFGVGDWRLTCGPSRGQNRCAVERAGQSGPDGEPRPALRLLYAPFTRGPAMTVCVGPPGAGRGALRVGAAGPWRTTARDGCLKRRENVEAMAELEAADAFAYRYRDPDGGEVAGERDLHGLGVALELARWLQWRLTARR